MSGLNAVEVIVPLFVIFKPFLCDCRPRGGEVFLYTTAKIWETLKKMKMKQRSGAAGGEVIEPDWMFYTDLLLLTDHIQPRK